MMIKKKLNAGDTVGIISPAGKIEQKYINNAIKHLESWGLNVIVGRHAISQENQFAGNDQNRANDFQNMLNNPSIKAIFCSRGGYGSIRTIENMDFSNFKNNHKWIIGYSDITVFHQFINNELMLPSIHGTMPKNFPFYPDSDHSLEKLKALLFGHKMEYTIPASEFNIPGYTEGVLIGGNLSIIYSLRGTKYDFDFKNKILFIEDVGEYLYHLDRMMMNLKVGEKLKQLKGVIIGGFSDMRDNDTRFGLQSSEIIYKYLEELCIPVCFNFPAGHTKKNLPLILGEIIKLEVTKNESLLSLL